MKIEFKEFPITDSIQFGLDLLSKKYPRNERLWLEKDMNIASQGYRRVRKKNGFVLFASEESGFLYGLLDLRDALICGEIVTISDCERTPYIKNRGIKFNIPLDARTPSYSDASDSAANNIENMWDYSFWTEFLDKMATAKFNVLSLWSLSPFPSLVVIPEYPLVALSDVMRNKKIRTAKLTGVGMYDHDEDSETLELVKKISINEKIQFWQSVMGYAKSRCIKIIIMTWNIFTFGTEGAPYAITPDQNNPVTKDYVYCGVKALMRTYPLLAGIGVTSGENMIGDASDISFLVESYGQGVRDVLQEQPKRDFVFIHRMQMARYNEIMEGFKDFPCPFEISFKYSQAHMYSSPTPKFIKDFLEEKDKDVKIWLTVRDDDYYYCRWGNLQFAKEYLQGMPIDSLSGYYLGSDGFTWGKDYCDREDTSHYQFFDKMWYMFSLWGKLSYDIDKKADDYIFELVEHFAISFTYAKMLSTCWTKASSLIPLVNCTHWHDFDFQWYPEGCCMYNNESDTLVFADIHEFIFCPSITNGDYQSVKEYCESKNQQKISPVDVADLIEKYALQALQEESLLRSNVGMNNKELLATLEDIEAMSYLGLYYAKKIHAAICLYSYRLHNVGDNGERAVSLLYNAAVYWKKYSGNISRRYIPQKLTRLCATVDFSKWDELVDKDILLAKQIVG